ncbi:MAG: flagellar filament outer layer protein FlaA [Brevinema sp.]
MKNKNAVLALIAILAVSSFVFAQDQEEAVADNQEQQIIQATIPPSNIGDAANMAIIPNDPEAENIGTSKVADENLQTVLVDDFEIPHGWQAKMPFDYGISRVLYRDGAPQAIASENNKMVLGVKTVFFRRNYGWMSVDRPFPLIIRSVVKNLTFWAVGRSRNHILSVKVRDLDNNEMRIKAGNGEMRWQGWKKLIVPVPDPVIQFKSSLNRRGLDIFGFQIDFVAQDINVSEATFFYFDYFTATVNFAGTQVLDDMVDNW